MKYLIEVNIPDDQSILHRPHIDVADILKVAVDKVFGFSDEIVVKVKKPAKK